ncbi:MAG TPA: DUF1566 domain-containing protein [Candidatus Binatia bacterium]|nr:DUF1566 domain-containing protein [Candidatus Binatia bacterium]
MKHSTCIVVIGVALSWRGAAVAGPPAEATSLNNCEAQVKSAAKSYVDGYINAVTSCLQAVSTQIIQKDAPDASKAASTCVSMFRMIYDSRNLGKSLGEKLSAAIDKKCAPGMPNVTHTVGDITGTSATVAQSIDAAYIGSYCSTFGGNGAIATLQDWTDCIAQSNACGALQTIAAQYPRAVEWLNLVQASMASPPLLAPPASDPNKITDAVAGLAAVLAIMDPGNTGEAAFQCGDNGELATCTGELTACDTSLNMCNSDLSTCLSHTCGNNLSENGEVCDGTDLNGQTCATLAPSTPFGTLACNASCTGFVTTGCVARYVDNGDGTVTDKQTDLIWEKKTTTVGSGTNYNDPHDVDNLYTWGSVSAPYPPAGTAFTDFLANLNGGAGPNTCFAGHCDWRLPSGRELASLLTYDLCFGSPTIPCIDQIFGPTQPLYYWTGETWAPYPSVADTEAFCGAGCGSTVSKNYPNYVRAVRGAP